jgi:hypothetical protein
MQVKETSLNHVTAYNATALKAGENQKKPSAKSSSTKESSTASASWQKEILMQALDKLENNRQMENIHPLDKRESAPIENYQEALNELDFLNTDTFNSQAGPAQANLNPQDVLYLFAND